MSRKTKTVLRTIFLGVSVANQFVNAIAGITKLFTNETFYTVYTAISIILTGLSAALAWWYNNSFTAEAQQADVYLDYLKDKPHTTDKADEYFIDEEGE